MDTVKHAENLVLRRSYHSIVVPSATEIEPINPLNGEKDLLLCAIFRAVCLYYGSASQWRWQTCVWERAIKWNMQ